MSQLLTALEMTSTTDTDSSQGFGALETDRGLLPLVALDVRTSICGLTAETTVRQTFRNSLDEPLEATYIFPLPDRAAVTKFQMRVAGRVIDGELKERGAAREEYDKAIEAGHRAAIAEEDRSGVFSLRVGNLPPREEATVELTLVGPLPVSDGEATYRFPLVVAPRYTPGVPLDGPSVGMGVSPDTNEVPDASRVTPPVLLPGFPNPVRLSLEVRLDPAGAAAIEVTWKDRVRSSLHATLEDDGPPWTVRLQPGERLDRDFILRFPVAAKMLSTALSASPAESGKPGLFALSLLPPTVASAKPKPREVVFLLDRSGSMGGWKMVAARRALARMVDTLLDQDQFALLAFDSTVEHAPHAKDALIPATNRDRWQMLEWLGKIDARGGTELAPALEGALKLFSATGANERHLVVVTDGQVSGEDAVLRRVSQMAGKNMPRIFTVGIDQAVNGGFLKRLADLGRGNCELVESENRLDEAMNRIHRLLGTPVLTQVRIEPLNFDLVADSLAPHDVPDLFADRPITVYGRHLPSGSPLRVRVHALDASGKAWQEEVVARPGPAALLQSVWGRAKVRELEDAYAAGMAGKQDELMRKIVAVSLESHVLSRFTAYVAIDRSEVVNAGGQLQRVVQPVELPAGWAGPAASPMAMGVGTVCFSLCAAAPMDAMSMSRGGSASRSRSMPKAKKAAERLDSESVDSMLQEFTDTPSELTSLERIVADDPAVIRLVDLLLREAVQEHATAIHFGRTANRIDVKLAINGQFVEYESPPAIFHSAIVARIRKLANLNSANPTYPQEGRFETTIGTSLVAWTVCITLTPEGESVVLTLESLSSATGDQSPASSRKKFWA